MADTTVKYFNSTMTGAPQCSGEVGKLIAILDACLVNGFGSVTLDSLVVASNVATGTVSAGHNFGMVGDVGPVVTIAGATPAGLNGEWRIASVPGSTTFTFATTGITDQTATGTITAKRSPLGFTKVAGDNKASYRADAAAGSRLYLRVDDSGGGAANYARVRGYETMSDVDTGTGPFPTDAQVSGGLYWQKSTAANNTQRPWRLIGDPQGFYLLMADNGTLYLGLGWIDILSEVTSDAYSTLLIAYTSAGSGGGLPMFAATGQYMARNYTQIGASININGKSSSYKAGAAGMGAATIMPYPATHNNGFYASSVEVWDTSTTLRGILPGCYAPGHIHSQLTDNTTVTGVVGLAGRTLHISKLINAGSSYAAVFDLTGPWR